MLEGLAAWVLKTYIGKYVNLNADKLSVGLLSGSVELENLPIIKDAFNDYELPFEVKFGHIGKIKLNISLNKLRNTPWSLLAEGLYLIIGPKSTDSRSSKEENSNKDNSNASNEQVDREKLDKLNSLDNRWFKEIELLNENSQKSAKSTNLEQSKWFSFGSIAYNIVKNLQVDIINLHIRYEDDVSKFAIGAHIKSISIKNGDQEASASSKLSSKLCELNEFRLYTDLNLIYSENSGISEEAIIRGFNLKLATSDGLIHLIQPTSFKAQIIRNLTSEPLRSSTKPRIRIKLQIDKLDIKLDLTQVKHLFQLISYINLYKIKLVCRSERPRIELKNNCKQWWKYAIKCVIKLQPKRLTIKNFIIWSKDVNLYKRIVLEEYSRTRITSSSATVVQLSNELRDEKKRIENEWNFKRLRLIRRTIFENFIKSSQYQEHLSRLKILSDDLKTTTSNSAANNEANKGVYNYFSWRLSNLWNYNSNSNETKKKEEDEDEEKGNEQIDNEVRELINDSIEDESLLRRDTILINLEFNLKLANIMLIFSNKEFLEFKLDNSKFLFEARPRHESYLFELNLDSAYLINKYDLKSKFINLIYPKTNQQQCFKIKYEHRPLNQIHQNKIKSNLLIKSTSLNIIFDKDYIFRLDCFLNDFNRIYKEIVSSRFIENTNQIALSEILNGDDDDDSNNTFLQQMNKINDKVQVNKLLNYNKYINNILFDIEFCAPNVLFPRNIYDEKTFIIILDFGKLTFLNKQLPSTISSTTTNGTGVDKTLKQSASTPSLLKYTDNGQSDDDDDDEFLTPVGTPPPEELNFTDEDAKSTTDASSHIISSSHEKLYFTYELSLNELQIVCGSFNAANLCYPSTIKYQSTDTHLIEKFDINFSIDICKFKNIGVDDDTDDDVKVDYKNYFSKLKLNKLPFVKINGKLNLLKVNVDYIKLTNVFETILNTQELLSSIKKQQPSQAITVSTSKSKHVLTKVNCSSSKKRPVIYVLINLGIDEINLSMSGTKATGEDDHRHSIAELRIFNINSEIIQTNSLNNSIKFSIYSLLLIDALQIYGNDYQLLAASHSNVLLDTKTASLIDINENNEASNALINFEMNTVHNKTLNLVENFIDTSFSTLDLILNPETISELIILFYSSFIHISNMKASTDDANILEATQSQQHNPVVSASHSTSNKNYVVNINFNFNQLSVLIFRIDEHRLKAEKVALCILEGTFININIENSNKKQLLISSKLNNLTVKDLQAFEDNYVYKHVFGIGFDDDKATSTTSENDEIKREIFEIIYRKDEKNETNLVVNMASIYYLHSPKLIFNLKHCFDDFKRFHLKIIDNISEKLANFAIRIYQKGKTLLKNTLADIYDDTSSLSKIEMPNDETSTKAAIMNINIHIKTPIIIFPMKLNSTKLFIAHLGHIHVHNNLRSFSNFLINLQKTSLFTIDLRTEITDMSKKTSLFQIYSKPKVYLKLVNDTNISINIDTAVADLLAVNIKLENESVIKICKLQFEQLLQTLDNIFYDENQTQPSELDESIKSSSTTQTATPESSHNAFYSVFSNINSELDTNIEIKFAINKLYIEFLADIIDDNSMIKNNEHKQIAELCFDNFELDIKKSEQYLTYVDVRLKSLYLIDKLNTSDGCKYLLLTVDDDHKDKKVKGIGIPRGGDKRNKTSYVSHSLPVGSISMQKLPKLTGVFGPTSKSTITFNKLEDYYSELDGSFSSSLPQNRSYHMESGTNKEDYPTTPPPSPFVNKFHFSKYESLENLKEKQIENKTIVNKNDEDERRLLVSIKLVLVDSRHKHFEKQYLSMNKFIKIKFSNLQLNVNPETWIFILDLLGIGSKVYTPPKQATTTTTTNRKSTKSATNFFQDQEEEEKVSNMSIEFEVKHFAILLNKNQQPMVNLNIHNINLFIENKCQIMKIIGKLGFLSIDEVSIYKGLYKDRFLTSGSEALTFELYKHQTPDPSLSREFDISLKLRMSSVKYVHIQRFIVHLTNYFNQFNQLQDALGRMRAVSLGKNVEYTVQRGTRILLNVYADTPIIIIPHHFKSNDALVFNLGNIKIENKFLIAGSKGTLNYEKLNKNKDVLSNESELENQKRESNCLLDVISVQFTDTDVYSAIRHDIVSNRQRSSSESDYDEVESNEFNNSFKRRNQVKFKTFLLKQYPNDILKKRCGLYIHIERNLDNELSHESPDWSIHAQLTSVNFCLDLKQYTLIKGLLEHNIGENISETVRQTFLLPNTSIETVLTGQVWNVISINFDLENVGIELVDNEMNSLADLSFIKSELIFESKSDQSRLIDLVSSEIILNDTRQKRTNTFSKVLYNPNSSLIGSNPKKLKKKSLQLEIHYRSNKNSNRYSIVFNSCRVIVIFDWLIQVKTFLLTNPSQPDVIIDPRKPTTSTTTQLNSVENDKKDDKFEVKLNLTNTDFVIIENQSESNSQALILRLTAFMEYNKEKKYFHSSLQSVELFSCYMNSIEKTALSIMDPVTFVINTKLLENTSPNADIFLLEVNTDFLMLRFSYLDFNLFVTLIESTKNQFQTSQQEQHQLLDANKKKLFSEHHDETMTISKEYSKNDDSNSRSEVASARVKVINLTMNRFCLSIIDDCKDVDVPLIDVQFNSFKLFHSLPDTTLKNIDQLVSNGNAEFSLNIDYYNRLLSGWEPLVETWLAQLNWKFKHDKNSVTLTSMGTLNINLTNAFIDLISIVYKNWKDDFDKARLNTNSVTSMEKRHKIFQPYKLINQTGSNLKFSIFEDKSVHDSSHDDHSWSTTSHQRPTSVSENDHEKWTMVEKYEEKEFNFFEKINILNKKRHLTSYESKNESSSQSSLTSSLLYSSTCQLKKLAQDRIRIKLDDTANEIEPITIDKVGSYYRDIKYHDIESRLIFDVSLSRNSTKLIKIKSPITIKNKLKVNIECKIESNQGLKKIYGIDAGKDWSIPIKYLPCKVWFRPLIQTIKYKFSSTYVNYIDTQKSGQIEYTQHFCESDVHEEKKSGVEEEMDSNNFYFFVKIKRLNFQETANKSQSNIPGHVIHLEPAVTLFNLLPIEFQFKLIKSSFTQISTNLGRRHQNLSRKNHVINEDKVDSYKCVYFHNIDASNSFDLAIDLDNLRMKKSLDIHPNKLISNLNSSSSSGVLQTQTSTTQETPISASSSSSPQTQSSASNGLNEFGSIKRHIHFIDTMDRPLILNARIVIKRGNSSNNDHQQYACPIQIYISAPYCFFNLTGVPLVYKQAFCKEAAGQQEEHEIARSNQAFLFNFSDNDSPYACSMRVGKHCNDFKNFMRKLQQQQKSKTNSSQVDAYQIVPKWCKPFSIESGSSFRALHVINNTVNSSSFHEDSIDSSDQYLSPDWVYYIGIEVKKGRGIFKDTNFIYFTTRFYLVNKTSKDLLISQYYAVESEREQSAYLWHHNSNMNSNSSNRLTSQLSNQEKEIDEIQKLNCLVLLNNSMVQFNWPRTDRDQLLSCKLKNDFNFNWSGGFKIDEVDTFYLNLRHKYNSSEFMFLRVEIFLEGGTFFIIISDYNLNLPPPIRIDNESEVEIYFYQQETKEENYCSSVKSKKSLNYTWDELSLSKKLIVGTRGGTKEAFDFGNQEEKKDIYYENFIYIVFKNDSKESVSNDGSTAKSRTYFMNSVKLSSVSSLMDNNELVLTVVNRNKITIKRKECSNRAQLWRMTADGLLVHEGSSAPNEFNFNAALNIANRYVLDIEDIAPQPNKMLALTLCRPDIRRNNTQKWTFTEDGYLCCKIKNMCLQIDGEFSENARVALGPMVLAKLLDHRPLCLMKVSRQRLKPGSGHLKCEMFNDGPTRVLKVVNVNQQSLQQINSTISCKDSEAGHRQEKANEVYIHLSGGIGISLVIWLNQEYEELVYAYFKMIELNFEQTHLERKIEFKIDSIQVCNQLLNSQRKNLIYIQMPTNSSMEGSQMIEKSRIANLVQFKKSAPALSVSMLQKFNFENLILIKELAIDLADVNLQIEEKLLWKLLQFIGFNKEPVQRSKLESKSADEASNNYQEDSRYLNLNVHESILNLLNSNENSNSFKVCLNLTNNYYKSIIDALEVNSKSTKYCFNIFKINSIKMNLSVYKTSKLANDLVKIKSSLGIPLIQFENARIELNPFLLMNEYDTSTAIGNILTKHYTQELKSHAMRILGSVDFLGNPLGLYADFLDSFSSVLSNGDFTELIFNLTHGVANSASKFTGSLSNELTELSMDEKHQETRETIRNNFSGGSVDHFIGGALGFAVGVVGGLTSVFSQTYRGFTENGLSGAFIGLGKGAIGTVSKPVVGILDLANGVATAIRDTSKTIDKMEIPRTREPRCCSIPGAMLTTFSGTDADGQKMLYKVNNFNLTEKYMAFEQLDDLVETLIGLVTSERVLFLIKYSTFEFNIIYQATYLELKGMRVVDENYKTYVELFLENPTSGESKSPRFKCKNRVVFNSFANKVRIAKASYDEIKYAIVYDFEE